MEDYVKNQRFTKVDRCRGGVSAHKVLAKSDNSVTVGVSKVLSHEGKVTLNMSDTSDIKTGDYLDFVSVIPYPADGQTAIAADI